MFSLSATRVSHVPVAEQFLHGADVVPVLQEMRCEGVAQGVRATTLGDPDPPHRGLHRALQDRLVQVVAT